MHKRIHIGGAARSGTTLLHVMMGNCFAMDSAVGHESHLWASVEGRPQVTCTKYPSDEKVIGLVLNRDADLYFICMLRDPRDVVTSIHDMAPDSYFTNLRVWRESAKVILKWRAHPRFMVVRYEDLVRYPNAIQRELMRRMPFLEPRKPFSEFYVDLKANPQAELAMHGVRPLTNESIGRWRQHKPRLAEQLARHGCIADDLLRLGYETDRAWLDCLRDVGAADRPSLTPDFYPTGKAVRRKLRVPLYAARYLIRRTVNRLVGMTATPRADYRTPPRLTITPFDEPRISGLPRSAESREMVISTLPPPDI